MSVKLLNTKFHQDLFSGSRVVIWGQADWRTDGALCNILLHESAKNCYCKGSNLCMSWGPTDCNEGHQNGHQIRFDTQCCPITWIKKHFAFLRKKYETATIFSTKDVRNTYRIVAGKPHLKIRLGITCVRYYVSGSYKDYDWLEPIYNRLHGITSQQEVRVKVSP
jgi:hypothetical protein